MRTRDKENEPIRGSECEDTFDIAKYYEGNKSYAIIENSGVDGGKRLC